MPPRPGHEPLSEQRLATGGGNTRAPARRPGRRTSPQRGLDGGRDELRGLRVDDDVPAEQNAADHLPDVPGRVVRADGGGRGTGGIGLGHTRECRRNGRFPYTEMTGGPAKIIVSATRCMDLPLTRRRPRNGADRYGRSTTTGRWEFLAEITANIA